MENRTISYLERQDKTVLLHGFAELRQQGKAVLRTPHSRLVLDADIHRPADQNYAYVTDITPEGVISDPGAIRVIRATCPDKKTAFVHVQNEGMPPFYVTSPVKLPDDYE